MRNRAVNILNNQRGIGLMVVLLMVVVLGLAAGIAGSSWKTVMQRVREDELLFRGDQYRRAIESYYNAQHGGQRGLLPSTLDDLIKDPRFPSTKRHLRQLYKDPMTGQEFEVIKDQTAAGRIKGVRSSSEDEPFKKDGFPKEYEKFVGVTSYKNWEFVYEPPKQATRRAPTTGQPGQSETTPVGPGGSLVPPGSIPGEGGALDTGQGTPQETPQEAPQEAGQ